MPEDPNSQAQGSRNASLGSNASNPGPPPTSPSTAGPPPTSPSTAGPPPTSPSTSGPPPTAMLRPPHGEPGKAAALEAYCCQQIQIPPQLPNILKAYTKGAIRTQPRDLLQWSGAYFRAMANGETPPVKDRLEYPVIEAPSGLSRGLLRVLHKQLKDKPRCTAPILKEKWKGICLNPADVDTLLQTSNIGEDFLWLNFVIVAAETIARNNVLETMTIVCEVMTDQPDGVDPYIPFTTWFEMYVFLAKRANVPMDRVQQVNDYLKGLANSNYGMIGPQNFLTQPCPQLF